MSDNRNTNDEMKKLNANETDKVSGGVLGFGDDYEDGHELSCFSYFHKANECKQSKDGYHYWMTDKNGYHRCKRCGEEP
ncbi:MAG: hypothetical protein E7241_11260 [Lachnospiraceae bacterium]|jgi:hypothetical protein|nr:hypothetical protein [Lachnospiraceae bacterium]